MSVDDGFLFDYWESILDAMPEVIIGTRSDGEVVFCKGNGSRIFGLDENEVIGKNITENLKINNLAVLEKGSSYALSRYFELDSRSPDPRKVILFLADHVSMPDGHGIWIFQDRTNQVIIDWYLDAYHDSLKEALIKEIEEKNESLEKLTQALVSALENANLFNDSETKSHIYRVGEYSALIAEAMGFEYSFVKKIRLYAPLHDVGKVGVPDYILKKDGPYTPEEYRLMRDHVHLGARMLDHQEIDAIAQNIARYHHERWDGEGYIEGLCGEEIPVEARIVAVSDVYDGMRTEKPYRSAASHDETIVRMKEMSGTSFDPRIIETVLSISDRIEQISIGESGIGWTTCDGGEDE